jgi:hypothetical protein
MPSDKIKIGQEITARGYSWRVIATEDQSYYGYCPPGSVIARNRAGDTIINISEITGVI